MKDTLLIGDFLFVNKMAYGYSRYSCPFAPVPDLGPHPRLANPSAAMWWCSATRSTASDFIKRLIGLPGDKIQMKDGVLFINGAEVPQVPDGHLRGGDGTARPDGATARAARTAPWARAAICTQIALHRDPARAAVSTTC